MTNIRKIKIEDKVDELNKLVKKFEDGKIGIEEGISEYEKGMKIIKDIRKELESLELKIEEISNN